MKTGASNDVVSLIAKPGNWAKVGHCAGSPDPDLWFADDHGKARTADVELAIQICNECPSRTECLIWALGVEPAHDWGVWGATTKSERVQMRKKKAAA